jgi:hypothetical protein
MSDAKDFSHTRISARFFLQQITEHGNVDQITVALSPAYSSGQNKDWAAATPSGRIELAIAGDRLAAEFFRSLLRDKDHNIGVEFFIVDREQ